LTVSVQGGVVMLSGELPSDTDYDKVVTMAQSIKGVGDVNADGLTVTSSQNPLTDTYITAKVKGSLIQYDLFTADIPSWTIGVETKNGQVHLSGTVKSQQDLDKIVQIAEKVKGVKEVDNKMVVNGSDDEMKQNGNGDATDNGNGTDSSN